MKKFLALFLALAMLLTLVACGGTTEESSAAESEVETESKTEAESEAEEEESEAEETAEAGRWDALQEVEEEVDLLLYWHNLQPTENEEPTEESPTVRNACRQITATWVEEHPNVNVEWCQNLEMTDEWVTVNYTAHTGPDTLFYWGGAQWVEQGMAMILDDIMASPNYYEPGSPVWKDMFPEYIFNGEESTGMCITDTGSIKAVPVVMAPGSDTAYYYNMDLAEELGISDVVATKSWTQLKENILTANEAGYIGTVMYNNGYGVSSGGSWDAQFSLNAAYFTPMKADLDMNGDDIVDAGEGMYYQWTEGYFYLENNPAMDEYWEEYMWKIHYALDDGAFDTDYSQPWADGQVLYIEEGLWSIVTYASNTELDFEVGMFPPPYADNSEYVAEIEWTDAGPYKPAVSVAFNIMEPSLQDRPECVADYVVDWMKFALTNDNLSIQIEEGEGVVGATKNCQVPTMMIDWFKQQFPKKPTGYWYCAPGLTDTTSTERNALFEEYMYGMIDHDTWVEEYDQLLYKGLCDYFAQEGYDEYPSAWAEEYGYDASVYDVDPVAPPCMQ